MNFMKMAFVVLFSVMAMQVFAQRDLIVTQAGEKIRCRILDETPTRFVYAYLGSGNKVLRSEIFKNLVASFKYNEFASDVVKQDKLPASKAGNAESTPVRIDTRKSPKQDTPSGESSRKADTSPPAEKVQPPVQTVTKENKAKAEKDKADVAKEAGEPRSIPLKKEPEKKEPEKQTVTAESKAAEKALKELNPPEERTATSDYRNFMKFRVGGKAGLANIINQTSSATDAYSLYREKLLKGWVIGADAAYFLTENVGIGATFVNYQSKHSSDKLTYPNPVTGEIVSDGSLSDKVSHKFVGPTFYYRKSIDFKTYVVLGLSPGMHFYTDKGTANNSSFTIKGQNYGGYATLGLDFLLGNDITGRDIILSLEGGYNYGKIKELNFGDERGNVTLTQPVNLNRLDFSIGLRFMRFPGYLR